MLGSFVSRTSVRLNEGNVALEWKSPVSACGLVSCLDEDTVCSEMGVRSDRPIRVTNLDPVGLTFPGLAVAKLHACFCHDPGPRGSHGCSDGHDKVISIFVGTAMATDRAVSLTHRIRRIHGIRKNIRRRLPVRECPARIVVCIPSSPADERPSAR